MAKFTKYNENQEIDGNIQSNGSSATTISSIAFGLNNTASGNYSQAFGASTTASGWYSHAEGQMTIASGPASHSEGVTTTAGGANSHAGGNSSIASGINSFVHGDLSQANGLNTIVLGANITGNTDNTTYVDALNIKTLGVTGTSVNNLGIDINGFIVNAATASDIYTTGFTFDNGTYILTATRNDGNNYTSDLSILATDMTITGGTYDPVTGNATFTNNSGGTFTVNGFLTGMTDTFTTGFTYNPATNILTISQNAGQPDLSVSIDTMSGLTVNGTLNATTISGGTYLGLPMDVFVTGGTYNAGTATFTNNAGTPFDVTGFFTGATDIYTTGLTFNPGTYDLTITRNDNVTYTTNLGILATDMTVTGGTYNSSTGNATFTDNSGGTFTVTGFLTGMTDTYVTGFTYSNNVITLSQNAGQPDFSILIDTLTGLTVNGTLSATTYLGLPMDVFVTGGTYNPSTGTETFTNNSGGTFDVTGLFTGSTDVFVSGGTYSAGTTTFTNTSGGTFVVTGMTSLNKYVATTSLTGGVTYTVPHNLATTDILIQFKDLDSNNMLNITVDNYQVNSVDITSVSSVANARIMIIGL